MIESTSSCTNLSASKPNFFTAQGTIACSTCAPGMSSCLASHASRRPAMPEAFGMPPTPGGKSSTRLHSVIANCPSRKNASRGSVATQFGLPRPAFRYDIEDSRAAFEATFCRKSLISNGPSFSYCLRFKSFIRCSSRIRCAGTCDSRKQHDHDHAPDRQQRVPHGIRDGVAERRDLAFGLVADEAERCRRRARPGDDPERQRVVEAEQVLGREHAEYQRDRGCRNAPQKETDALRLQAVDESRPGGDADDGDEDVEAHRIHEPDRGRRDA